MSELEPQYEELAQRIALRVAEQLQQLQPVVTPEYLPPAEAAALLNVPERTLQNWRAREDGPPFFRYGQTVRYLVSDLREWARSRQVRTE